MGVNDDDLVRSRQAHHGLQRLLHHQLRSHHAVKVLHEKFGIVKGFMTTIHSYTNDQRILDQFAQGSFVAARAARHQHDPDHHRRGPARLALVLPELNGKLDGLAHVRVPTPDASLTDLVG